MIKQKEYHEISHAFHVLLVYTSFVWETGTARSQSPHHTTVLNPCLLRFVPSEGAHNRGAHLAMHTPHLGLTSAPPIPWTPLVGSASPSGDTRGWAVQAAACAGQMQIHQALVSNPLSTH